MQIIKHRKIYFTISIILLLGSLFSLIIWGLKLGIDFTGGALMEISYTEEELSNQEIREKLSDLNLGQINIQSIGEKNILLRIKEIDEDTHQEILNKLDNPKEERFE